MNKFSKALSAALLAVTLVSAVGCASTSTKEGTGEYVDDSVITTKVKAAIFNEPTLKSAEINVETFKGVVQLSGFVNSQADINKAVEVTRSVKGVTSSRTTCVSSDRSLITSPSRMLHPTGAVPFWARQEADGMAAQHFHPIPVHPPG